MKKDKKINVNPLAIFLGSVIGLYTLLMFAMLFWGVMVSLMKPFEFYSDDINGLIPFPSLNALTFENYEMALQNVKEKIKIDGKGYYVYLPEMFFNSLVYSVGCSFFATLTPCLVAYVTAKYKVKFNDVIYMTVIIVMITPIVGNLPSQMEMAKNLGLYDSQAGMWFMSATFLGTYYLVFYGIFKGLSWEYAEAAFIDGAGHFKVMVWVMLPLVKNTFLVVFILNFIARWNDYQTPLLMLPNSPVAAVGVYRFYSGTGDNATRHVPILFAAAMSLFFPALILFVAFKDKFVGNLTVGGIKG